MTESILKHRTLLLIENELGISSLIEEEIFQACPDCEIDKVHDYEMSEEILRANCYDLLILDIIGVGYLDLLRKAAMRGIKVAVIADNVSNTREVREACHNGASAYLPKSMVGLLVPFLEDVLKYERMENWRYLARRLRSYNTSKTDPIGMLHVLSIMQCSIE